MVENCLEMVKWPFLSVANFGQHPLGIEKSRFAGIKRVISKTTLGLRSKKLPLAELPN
jgi:hypothetical protein